MKVSITGSSGFVGQNLAAYLCNLNIIVRPIDLRKRRIIPLALSETIIHLAGKAHDLKNVSRPEEYYKVNFELTKKLYNAFLKSEVKKFIFISSVKAAADSVAGILTEDVVPKPQTHYGKSKLMAEKYIQDQPLPPGKSYYILRPCMIHGPGNKGNLNLLYQLVAKGIPYPLASFQNKRSFLSAENLCFIIKEIVERNNIPTGVYNVADDEALSTNDLIRLLSTALGKTSRLWKVPQIIIKGLASLGDKLHLPLNTERLNKLTENYIVSNQKIKLILNKELPLTTDQGILKTAAALRSK